MGRLRHPVLHEDDALRAVRAAAQMREALAALNTELEAERGVTIATRTGITTGEVVAGDPSAGQTLVTGDTVNTAARLEQAAAPGEILIGEPTAEAAWRTRRRDGAAGRRTDPTLPMKQEHLACRPARHLAEVAEPGRVVTGAGRGSGTHAQYETDHGLLTDMCMIDNTK